MQIPTITVKDKNKSIQLEIKRMSLYKQSQIIEATNEQDQIYYIFFYKEHYLNYVTPQRTTTHSYVLDSFKKGLALCAPHPLIEAVVSSYPHFKKQNNNDLFRQLQKQYPPQETALIASYFEPYIAKDKLAEFIQTLFYKERRDGKLLSCYRIFRILQGFAPNHSLIQTFSRDLEFTKYDDLYQTGDKTILAKDPIYVEDKLYANLDNDQDFQKLVALYQKQNRLVDLIAISIKHTIYTQKITDYATLKVLIDDHFNDVNKVDILEDLYKRGLILHSFLQDLVDAYIENKELEGLLILLSKHELTLQQTQSSELIGMVKQRKITPGSIPPEGLQRLVLTLFEAKDVQAADVLHQAIVSLMNDHTLPYVQEWALPFKDNPSAAPTLQKVDEMNRILEDPSQQQSLGELYHYFHQPKLAIECMSFDMELNEDDPKPVQWLAKLYQEIGMNAEYKAYQQLYIDMVKRS